MIRQYAGIRGDRSLAETRRKYPGSSKPVDNVWRERQMVGSMKLRLWFLLAFHVYSRVLGNKQLEMLIDVQGERYKAYCWERLKSIVQHGVVLSTQWDGGGEFQGRKWSSDRPTDAQVCMLS